MSPQDNRVGRAANLHRARMRVNWRTVKPPDDRPNPAERAPQVNYDNPQGCLLRLFWMAIGNLALLVLILSISNQQGFTLLDGLYWVVVTALASARYIDITRFAGLTVDGTPRLRSTTSVVTRRGWLSWQWDSGSPHICFSAFFSSATCSPSA
ncbi:MAG: hypothetical protein ACRD1Q_09900 [Vicinamibacterales bacterium]